MVQALIGIGKKPVLLAILGCVFVLGSLAQQDPPSRVARLNYVSGNVSMEPAGVADWAPAEINHPFTVGDYLYTDAGARAELHLDIAAIRMDSQTSFGFLNLNDQAIQIKLTEGDMYFRLHHFGPDQVFEVDTPNVAVQLLRDGIYRFRVDPNGAMSFVVVREGQAEVTVGGQAFTISPNNSVLISGADQSTFDVERAPVPDEFDSWCAERDAREARAVSQRYLPPTVIGYEDLDQYGTWQEEADYGPVWYPRPVAVDWAPYHYGHWAWIAPWGWTWVDAAPWGFAPFHYGRWAYIGNRWGWCPGPVAIIGHSGPVIRPYYAPALVAWFGGAHWGVSISSGPSLGWVPLGFGEVFTPSYACSRHYFDNVNIHNTRIVRNVNITNVYNTVYVNKTVYNQQFVNVHAPNAVQVMPQSAFANGRPVHQAGVVLRQADLRQLGGTAVVAPGVAPTRQAILAMGGHPVVHPIPQVINRQVIAVHAPAVIPGQSPVAAAIRPAPMPTHPVQVQPGQRFGRSEAFRQPNSPLPPQQATSPVQPQSPISPAQPAVHPASPQPVHGVPSNIRGAGNLEDHRNERLREQPPAPPNTNRPFMERPQPQPPQNGSVNNRMNTAPRPESRPAERPAPPPAPPQHEQRPPEHIAPPPPHEQPMMRRPEPRPEVHPAPEAPHNQPPAPHAQPSPPPPPPTHHEDHQNHPPEHGGDNHNGPKTQ